jgi:hypothetical protein
METWVIRMEVPPPVNTKRLGKKLAATLLVIIVLATSIVLIAATSSAPEPTTSDTINPEPQLTGLEAKGLQFIKDVLSIDTAKYNITVSSMNNPTMSIATAEQIAQAGSITQYKLNSSSSAFSISFQFNNNHLTWSNLYIYSGSIIYTQQPSSNLTEAAQNFLTAYQEFSGRNVTDMLQTLQMISPANGSTASLGDLRLTATHVDLLGTYFGDNYLFDWVNIYSGFDYKYLSITFQDGHFGGFFDHYLRYPIGDTSVNITAQQALQIGLEASKTYSYDMGAGITVSNFSIASTEVILNPQTENDILYPCYTVYLHFNGTYPGSVHGLIVYIWAGSGEIDFISLNAYCEPTDHY